MTSIDAGPIRVLVLSSCSGEKKYDPSNKALPKELDNLILRQEKEKELADYSCKAREMFISPPNQLINEGLNCLPEELVPMVDWYFISAGYGFINSEDPVIPYDINLSAMSTYEIDKRSEFLNVHQETFYQAKNYQLVFFILRYEYLRLLKLPMPLADVTKQIYLVSHSDEKILPENHNYHIIKTGNEESSRFNVTPSELKGHIFRAIGQASVKDPSIFNKIYSHPQIIETIMEKGMKNRQVNNQLSLFDI